MQETGLPMFIAVIISSAILGTFLVAAAIIAVVLFSVRPA